MEEKNEKKQGKEEEKKECKHVWNSKGYCEKCGTEKERYEMKHGDKADKKEEKKESKEHPEFGKKTIHKIVEDHERVKEEKK